MPLYEYYCDTCEAVFDALKAIASSDQPAKCPTCGGSSDRIMPTTFASMSRNKGLRERVPYHHHDVRNVEHKTTIARVKPKTATVRKPSTKTRTTKD